MTQASELAAALAAGIRSSVDGTAEAEAAEDDQTTPPAEGAQPTVVADTEAPTPEAQAEASAEGTGDEPPAAYFGEDLSGFDASQRAEIISMLEKRDDFIGKLLREKAEAPGDEPVVEAQPAPEPVTDEQLLAQLGLDVENNPFDESTAKVALPLMRALQQQQDLVTALVEQQELQALETQWTTALDTLEGEYGELPIDRVAVLEYAAERGIQDPAAAYWTIAGPAKKQLIDAVRSQQARPKPPATTRPKGTGQQTSAPLEAKTVKDAVAEAARRVAAEKGFDIS